MVSYPVKKDEKSPEWSVEWDDSIFCLKDEVGQVVAQCARADVYRTIDIFSLYGFRLLSIPDAGGKKVVVDLKRSVSDEIRALIEPGLRADRPYRLEMGRHALSQAYKGAALLGVSVGLMCLYVVIGMRYLSAPADSGAGMGALGGAIHAVLLVVIVVGLLGIKMMIAGIRQRGRLRRFETDAVT